jgi:hypothetical protein
MASSSPSKGRISLPARRLSVRKIKEVLRLRFELGLGLRAIARSCSIGLGLGTAHEYLQRAEAAGRSGKIGMRIGNCSVRCSTTASAAPGTQGAIPIYDARTAGHLFVAVLEGLSFLFRLVETLEGPARVAP